MENPEEQNGNESNSSSNNVKEKENNPAPNVEVKRRKYNTVKEKLKAVEEFRVDPKKIDEICMKYGINHKMLIKWRDQKADLQTAMKNRIPRSAIVLKPRTKKTVRKYTKMDQINDEVYRWFKRNSKAGMTFNGSMIRQKAIEINRKIQGKKEFGGSFNWLSRWRNKYKIDSKYVYNGSSDDDTSSDEQMMEMSAELDEPEEQMEKEPENRPEVETIIDSEDEFDAPNVETITESEESAIDDAVVVNQVKKNNDHTNPVQIQNPIDYESIDCIQKVIDYFKSNLVASDLEMDVLIKLKKKAEDYERNKNHKNKIPNFSIVNNVVT